MIRQSLAASADCTPLLKEFAKSVVRKYDSQKMNINLSAAFTWLSAFNQDIVKMPEETQKHILVKFPPVANLRAKWVRIRPEANVEVVKVAAKQVISGVEFWLKEIANGFNNSKQCDASWQIAQLLRLHETALIGRPDLAQKYYTKMVRARESHPYMKFVSSEYLGWMNMNGKATGTTKTLTHTLRKELAAAPGTTKAAIYQVKRRLFDWKVNKQVLSKDGRTYEASYEGNAIKVDLTIRPTNGPKIEVIMDFEFPHLDETYRTFSRLANDLVKYAGDVNKASRVDMSAPPNLLSYNWKRTKVREAMVTLTKMASSFSQYVEDEISWSKEELEELDTVLSIFDDFE